MKIGITGGSGFIGSALSRRLSEKGHQVFVIDLVPPREKVQNISFIRADLMRGDIPPEVKDLDAVVHLAGASIYGRWTEKYKQIIKESRVKSAENLFHFISTGTKKPSVFISASAVGIYGSRGEEELTEESLPGRDFLAEVCQAWEAECFRFKDLGVRSVAIRTGIVLGPGGGMMQRLVKIFSWGLGGRLSSGRQWFSWIHLEDLLALYETAIFDQRFSGPINAVSPNPLRNKEFTRALGSALHRPTPFWIPKMALRLVLGEFASAVLASQKVSAGKVLRLGFVFKYPDIYSALTDI